MKKTILLCGLLLIGLATLSACYPYSSRVGLGLDYNGYYAGYYPYYSYSYPYYYPNYYYPYTANYYPYYYPYLYPYPYFSLGFGFYRGFYGYSVRGGRGGGGRAFR